MYACLCYAFFHQHCGRHWSNPLIKMPTKQRKKRAFAGQNMIFFFGPWFYDFHQISSFYVRFKQKKHSFGGLVLQLLLIPISYFGSILASSMHVNVCTLSGYFPYIQRSDSIPIKCLYKYYLVLNAQCRKRRILCILTRKSWNQLFGDLFYFSKYVVFTKFLPKKREWE